MSIILTVTFSERETNFRVFHATYTDAEILMELKRTLTKLKHWLREGFSLLTENISVFFTPLNSPPPPFKKENSPN